jgi:uncharacterized protein
MPSACSNKDECVYSFVTLEGALQALLGHHDDARGLTHYGTPGWLRLERIDVAVRGLPPTVEVLTIGHLSDLHVGPHISPSLIAEAVELVLAQRPQLIAITGDFIASGTRYLEAAADAVAALRAPLGVYAVLGNHDYFGDAPRLRSLLEARGVRVLCNEPVPLWVGQGLIWLVGLDDALAGRPSFRRAFAGVPANDFKLLLAHEPDLADEAAHYGVALQLSGHTHGGQLRHSQYGALVLPRLGWRYPQGLYHVAGGATQVYTNRGIGVSGTRLRYGCPPEVALLTLRPASPA